ncbi:TetR/AcrR family transcriptional regulator [Curtobacterium sp. 18060]|uniref:TetR/AcrR family transcriptional regulator n=1 Tax=Curtobacterium sp. 18060 TaxID=2681408 RepID=UPI00190F3630|nr:TetR family transcriptional regulator [Curtobacterium sp. 18060]
MTGSIDRDTIVRTARRMLEQDGVDALSMRRLATELGSRPMSLYYYVPSKDDLLLAVLEAVAAEIPWAAPSAGTEPRDRMLQVVVDMADRLRDVGWVVDVLRAGTHVGIPALALADRFIGAARQAGATAQQALDTWRACWYLVASELQWQRSLQLRGPEDASWYERVDPADLADVPEVRTLIGEWSSLSAHFDLEAVLAAQIDGAIAHFGAR